MTTFVEMVEVPMHGYSEPVLVGKDQESRKNISKCRKGVVYRVVPKKTNNSDFHRKVMRLMRDLYENQEQFDSEDVHREYVKLQCGWVHEVAVPVAEHDRLVKCAEWLRSLARLITNLILPEQATGINAAADLIDSCKTHYVTKPLSFDKCDQAEREHFWESLKRYAVPILGAEHVASYESL